MKLLEGKVSVEHAGCQHKCVLYSQLFPGYTGKKRDIKETRPGEEMATHSSVLTWRISGTGEPGRLPSMGSHRVRQD